MSLARRIFSVWKPLHIRKWGVQVPRTELNDPLYGNFRETDYQLESPPSGIFMCQSIVGVMQRRTLLASVSGLTALAGCSTVKELYRMGPPHFEEVELTGPETVPVGESVEMTVSATNTGGEPGDFTNTITIGRDSLSRSENVRIPDIGVYQTKSTTLGPFRIGSVREVEFRITDFGASHTIAGSTVQLVLTDPLTVPQGRIQLTDFEYRGRFTAADGIIQVPSTGDLFAFLKVSVELPSGQDASFPPHIQTE